MIHFNSGNSTGVLIKQNKSIKTGVKLSIHPELKIKTFIFWFIQKKNGSSL